jgi:multisubunit Na+/H+ antiporter MnhC subunit
MHWFVIITLAIQAILSAWLVFFQHWDKWVVMFTVAGGAIGLVLLLLGGLMVFNSKHRRELWQIVRVTFVKDLQQLGRFFSIRKNK